MIQSHTSHLRQALNHHGHADEDDQFYVELGFGMSLNQLLQMWLLKMMTGKMTTKSMAKVTKVKRMLVWKLIEWHVVCAELKLPLHSEQLLQW